ncbi:MAG: carboxylating nicotinate-nucleotide diphosphorylase, partial [Polymorphobacter sp.]
MTEPFSLAGFDTQAFVAATLAEDLGSGGDRTSAAVIPADAQLRAVMASRDEIVVAGLPLALAFIRALDAHAHFEVVAHDGDHLPAGSPLLRISA